MRQYWDKQGKLLWLAPGAVPYDRESVEFLLPYLYDMREGRYIPEPVDSGYIGGNKGGIKSHAPFETVCQVAAELDVRLAQCGLDRVLVQHSYIDGMSDSYLAIIYSMEEWQVRRKINAVVGYISSGRCGRWIECSGDTWVCMNYQSCKALKKLRLAVSYTEWKGHRRKRKISQCDSKLDRSCIIV